MKYEDLIRPVAELEFIRDEETADAAVKASLGILASMMKEEDARAFTEMLPEPLTVEKLRSHQANALKISTNEYVKEIDAQFNLDEDKARRLAHTVINTVREHLPENKRNEWEGKLFFSDEWKSFLEKA